MNRTIIFTIVTVLLIGGGVGAYIIFGTKHQHVAVTPANSFPTAQSGNSSGIAAVGDTHLSSTTASVSSISPSSIPRFVKITNGPVAPGVVTFDSTSTPSVVHTRYIERKSGNMYDYNVRSKALTRISNNMGWFLVDGEWSKCHKQGSWS